MHIKMPKEFNFTTCIEGSRVTVRCDTAIGYCSCGKMHTFNHWHSQRHSSNHAKKLVDFLEKNYSESLEIYKFELADELTLCAAKFFGANPLHMSTLTEEFQRLIDEYDSVPKENR